MPRDQESALELFFDQTNQVFLAAFSGVFTRESTLALNRAARAVVERHGHVVVILDFSAVTEIALQLRDWPELGNDRRAIRGKRRLLVAPMTPVFSPLRLHGTHHRGAVDDTEVVATRAAAFRRLGLEDPTFEPIELG
jgi:hypothetical protein